MTHGGRRLRVLTSVRTHPVVFLLYLATVTVAVAILVTDVSESTPDAEASASGTGEHTLELLVSSTKDGVAAVSYVTPGSEPLTISQQPHARLPWRRSFAGVAEPRIGFNVHAVASGAGRLSCAIRLDGEVVAEDSSDKDPALVTCAYR